MMSESGKTVETLTKLQNKGTGGMLKSVTHVTKYWSRLSPLKRRCIWAYAGIAFASYSFRTYNDGKQSLLAFRNGNFTTESNWREKISTDWDATYYGCKKNSVNNFFSSIFFPYTWVSDAAPAVVLQLNPPNKN